MGRERETERERERERERKKERKRERESPAGRGPTAPPRLRAARGPPHQRHGGDAKIIYIYIAYIYSIYI